MATASQGIKEGHLKNSIDSQNWGSSNSTVEKESINDDITTTLEFQDRMKLNNQVFVPSKEKTHMMNFAKIETATNKMSSMSYQTQRTAFKDQGSSATSRKAREENEVDSDDD
ncbi:hypothetical protein AX774_g1349 [Zancudomyces culisetae]|uniref:Uncharacterized protein n=1 Tax=Zancudomyces culisetae TaxID=1213189 RepID=A0A1R1PHN1_ZANCU|nr:hypothetical protein AX774_g6076 [Zancudomyces culisetae]OMH85129.1 hypothetical protein AX774_g1349 [Zancudomyces culisetae]|eukprot:OMH80481.1 hypothetical protein AX774_g6076 [Zancudomyces culisetae]